MRGAGGGALLIAAPMKTQALPDDSRQNTAPSSLVPFLS